MGQFERWSSRFDWVAVLFGQRADGGLFARGDDFDRTAVSRPTAQLDFDEDDGVSLAEDEIQLPEPGPIVAFEELVARSLR